MIEAEDYFDWLCKRAGVVGDDSGYVYLCRIMHDYEFEPLLEMDWNRWQDGISLRDQFSIETGADILTVDQATGDCTCLELVLSLAERMRYELQDSPYEAGTDRWFLELIGNLGLDIFTNHTLREDENAYFEAQAILRRFVNRKYEYSGEGGLFPLLYPATDQRKEELLIQMNSYLAENYDVLGEGTV